MTKNEYLAELRSRLHRLSEDDQKATMDFYIEYFEDASSDLDAIAALGSPARLAAQLVAGFSAQSLSEKSVSPFNIASEIENEKASQQYEMPTTSFPSYSAKNEQKQDQSTNPPSNTYTQITYPKYSKSEPQSNNNSTPVQDSPYTTASGRKNSFSSIWYVILGICSLPIALPLVAVAIAFIAAILAIIVALICVCFAVIATLIAGVVAAISFFLSGSGPFSLGVVLILIGIALILIPLLIMLIVWLVRAFGRICAKMFNKLKERHNKNENQQ